MVEQHVYDDGIAIPAPLQVFTDSLGQNGSMSDYAAVANYYDSKVILSLARCNGTCWCFFSVTNVVV